MGSKITRKNIYRESAKGLPMAFLLVVLGLGVGGALLIASARQGEVIGIILASVVGLGFVGFGVAWILKVVMERVEVSDWGIRKWGFPGGNLHFQCSWHDVISYQGHTASNINRSHPGIKAYTLQTPHDSLTISGYTSYFPGLHSSILSNLPENARIGIPGTPDRRDDPIRPDRTWRLMSARRFGLGQVFLFLVGAVLCYFGAAMDAPIELNGQLASDQTGSLLRYGMIGVGSLICVAVLAAVAVGRGETVRISPKGIEHRRSRKILTQIPWEEVISVEALYRYRAVNDGTVDGEPVLTLHYGPRVATHYAVIGRNGRAIRFSSGMDDFGGFLSMLRRASPEEVIFGTDQL